jgi:hypothetical protein
MIDKKMTNYNLADATAAVLTEAKKQQKLARESIEAINEAVRQFNGRANSMPEEVKGDMRRVLKGCAQEAAEDIGKHFGDANVVAKRAAAAYRNAEKSASWKVTLLAMLLGALAIGATTVVALYVLPNEKKLDALRAEEARLQANLAALEKRGARADIRPCGDPKKPQTCVRIDRNAIKYGKNEEYRVIATN